MAKKTRKTRKPANRAQVNALIDKKVARRFRDHCRSKHVGRDATLQALIEEFLASVENEDQHLFVLLHPDVAQRVRAYREVAQRPDRSEMINAALEQFIETKIGDDRRMKRAFEHALAGGQTVH